MYVREVYLLIVKFLNTFTSNLFFTAVYCRRETDTVEDQMLHILTDSLERDRSGMPKMSADIRHFQPLD